jgi:hypothetical protein
VLECALHHIFRCPNSCALLLQCYLVRQTRHHGNGDNLCHMHNVAVDLRLFGDDSQTRNVIKTYVDTKHGKQPYIKFPKGELSFVQCCVERFTTASTVRTAYKHVHIERSAYAPLYSHLFSRVAVRFVPRIDRN